MIKKRKRVGGFTLPDFKTYYKATVIKTVYSDQNSGKKTDIDQWNGIERYNHCTSGQNIFDKVPAPFKGEMIVFSTNDAGKTEYP